MSAILLEEDGAAAYLHTQEGLLPLVILLYPFHSQDTQPYGNPHRELGNCRQNPWPRREQDFIGEFRQYTSSQMLRYAIKTIA
jgi:hypothetical protein